VNEPVQRVNVFKNGELVEESVEKPVSTVRKLDGHEQFNKEAGDFEKFRVEVLDDVPQELHSAASTLQRAIDSWQDLSDEERHRFIESITDELAEADLEGE
jgi:hypothetical protein